MSSNRPNIAVIFTDLGAAEMASPLRLWMKNGDVFGHYVYCKSVDPNGPYFHMVIEEAQGVDFEVQVQHAYVKAVICSADFKRLGFTVES